MADVGFLLDSESSGPGPRVLDFNLGGTGSVKPTEKVGVLSSCTDVERGAEDVIVPNMTFCVAGYSGDDSGDGEELDFESLDFFGESTAFVFSATFLF